MAEHRETLCIYSVITNNKKGYSKHPETIRYRHNLSALVYRHRQITKEARKRHYNFKELPNSCNILALNHVVKSWDNQEYSLSLKDCECIKDKK